MFNFIIHPMDYVLLSDAHQILAKNCRFYDRKFIVIACLFTVFCFTNSEFLDMDNKVVEIINSNQIQFALYVKIFKGMVVLFFYYSFSVVIPLFYTIYCSSYAAHPSVTIRFPGLLLKKEK
jgi:hypothetical protein